MRLMKSNYIKQFNDNHFFGFNEKIIESYLIDS
jgi:hypothetical protein